MKITKKQLKDIIAEEMNQVLSEQDPVDNDDMADTANAAPPAADAPPAAAAGSDTDIEFQGGKGDPYEYKEVGAAGSGKYQTRKKGADSWIDVTNKKAIDSIRSVQGCAKSLYKPKPTPPATPPATAPATAPAVTRQQKKADRLAVGGGASTNVGASDGGVITVGDALKQVQSGDTDLSYGQVSKAGRKASKARQNKAVDAANADVDAAKDMLRRAKAGLGGEGETIGTAKDALRKARDARKAAKKGGRKERRGIRQATRAMRPGIFEEGAENEGELLQEQTEMNRWKKIAGLNENKK